MIPGIPYLRLAAIAALAIAVLSALGYVWWLRHEVTNLRAENATLVAVNAANVAEVEKVKADAAAEVAALTKEHAAALLRTKRTATLKQDIARAPKTDDAIAAPVLAGLLSSLRQRASGGDQGSPPANPPRVPGVHP